MSSPSQTKARVARSAARLAAVQGLYQMDIASTDLNAVLRELTDKPIDETATGDAAATPATAPPDATFLGELLRGVVRRQREIDPLVDQQLATGWRLVRVDSILRAILRAGVLELMERPRRAGTRRHHRVYRRRACLFLGRRAARGERRAR